MNTLSLSKKEIKQINNQHICAVDKFYRMFGGAASELTAVLNGVIYLQISYSNSTKGSKSNAVNIARSWLNNSNNAVLLDSHTMVITEYFSAGAPGGFIPVDDETDLSKIKEKLDPKTMKQFGQRKRFRDRKIFTVNELLYKY